MSQLWLLLSISSGHINLNVSMKVSSYSRPKYTWVWLKTEVFSHQCTSLYGTEGTLYGTEGTFMSAAWAGSLYRHSQRTEGPGCWRPREQSVSRDLGHIYRRTVQIPNRSPEPSLRLFLMTPFWGGCSPALVLWRVSTGACSRPQQSCLFGQPWTCTSSWCFSPGICLHVKHRLVCQGRGWSRGPFWGDGIWAYICVMLSL